VSDRNGVNGGARAEKRQRGENETNEKSGECRVKEQEKKAEVCMHLYPPGGRDRAEIYAGVQ